MIKRRERKKGRRRDREGGRDKRKRERQRERWKARRVNPTLRLMLSPNYVTRACKKREGDAHGSLFKRKILVKSPERGKVKLWAEITRKKYYRKLWVKIISENHYLVYQWRKKLRFIGILAYQKISIAYKMGHCHFLKCEKNIFPAPKG